MTKYGLIDTDSHVIEPDDLWEKYLEAKYRAEAPVSHCGYRRDERGFGFFNDVTIGDCKMPIGVHGKLSFSENLGERYEEYAAAGFPASAYVEAMDKVGIDYMILYPTVCLYTNQAPKLKADVAAAYRRAYNNWLHDFCSEDASGRLIGAGAIDLRDPEAAAAEAVRAVKELGFKAIMINPTPVGGPALYAPEMDRLWATIADLDVPVGVHCCALNATDKFLYDYYPDLMYAQGISAFAIGNMAACASFIVGGVLERHPKLRIAHLEAGSGWVAFWLYRLQHAGQGANKGLIPGLTMGALDYWQRQCYISTEPSDPGIKQVIDMIGDGNIVLATDFSHPEGRDYVDAHQDIAKLAGVSEASKRKVKWENALKLYALDAEPVAGSQTASA